MATFPLKLVCVQLLESVQNTSKNLKILFERDILSSSKIVSLGFHRIRSEHRSNCKALLLNVNDENSNFIFVELI